MRGKGSSILGCCGQMGHFGVCKGAVGGTVTGWGVERLALSHGGPSGLQ